MVATPDDSALGSIARGWANFLQAGVHEVSLDGRLALIAAQLPDFHKDPADRFIVATAIHHRAVLITADANILDCRGQLTLQNARF